MASVPKLTPKLAQKLYYLIDELGEDFISDGDGTVYEKAGVVWNLNSQAAASYVTKLEQLGLITLERRSGRIKIHRLTVAPGAYQTAVQLATKAERSPISHAAQRADREMRAIPQAAASRLRLNGLRGDRCR